MIMYNKRFPTFESAFQFLKSRWNCDMSSKVDRFIADWLFTQNNIDDSLDFDLAMSVADRHHFENSSSKLISELSHGRDSDTQLFFNF